ALGAVVAALLAAGVFAATRGGADPGLRVAGDFARAWERGNHAEMHALLSAHGKRRASARRLARTYARIAETATIERVATGTPVASGDGAYTVPVRLRTRIFGDVRGRVRIPVSGEADDGSLGVDWSSTMAFPGLRRGERLTRATELAPRADILARDGTPLADGPSRVSELGALAAEIAGRLGPIPDDRRAAYARLGVPEGTSVGLTGLEREFDERLIGRPGGTLRAGERVLARAEPRQGSSVRTSIDPSLQAAAVEALAGRFGGVAVLRPQTGEVLALAGIAYSAPQPPGSTFKIVTLAGALEAGTVRRSARFPEQTATTLEGVELENANGEVCGGSLSYSFAESCNSVFAPMGAKLGAERLVAAAERFGFNERPSVRGAAPSTIPDPGEIGDDLSLGSHAIGQGRTLATPLQMASVAATIAQGGRRVLPSLLRGGGDAKAVRATTPEVARIIGRFMRRVVTEGTGTAAAIKGVKVAGKTGTAELRDTTKDPATGEDVAPGERAGHDPSDTDAWFTAYAPAGRPRVAVAVLLVGQGSGGETAAPAARQVIQAALGPG
ncbi:MAG: penicillin-binding transpeptidase domain-containing protein, partial [Actinomycetota bacterium]|nr:penicillin-binding transpeptidase domain-containing protein [Actinomycetota bacterium]